MNALRWGLAGGVLTALVSIRCDDAEVIYTIPEPVPDASVALDAGTTPVDDARAPAPVELPDASPDADDAADAEPDAVLDADATCEQKYERFAQFVADNRSCNGDADCSVIGDCDFNADWAAVRASAAAAGYSLMRTRCGGIADGPTYAVHCIDGQCLLGEENGCCGCPADGGL